MNTLFCCIVFAIIKKGDAIYNGSYIDDSRFARDFAYSLQLIQAKTYAKCTGFIVNQYCLGTAAHCFTDGEIENYVAVLGTRLNGLAAGSVQINISQSLRHPELDFMLIKFSNKIELTGMIKPVYSLNVQDTDVNATECFGFGYGMESPTRRPGKYGWMVEMAKNETIIRPACDIEPEQWQMECFTSPWTLPARNAFCPGDSGTILSCENLKQQNSYLPYGIYTRGWDPCDDGPKLKAPERVIILHRLQPWLSDSINKFCYPSYINVSVLNQIPRDI